jgi:3-hydroxyacyl-CoA dehydrogenase
MDLIIQSIFQINLLNQPTVSDGELGIKSGLGFYDYSKSKKAETVSKRFVK